LQPARPSGGTTELASRALGKGRMNSQASRVFADHLAAGQAHQLAGPANDWDRSAMSSIRTAIVVALLAFGSLTSHASAQGADGTNVIIRLRLSGNDGATLPSIRSCLVDKLSRFPDVKVETVPTDGVRFILDIVATEAAKNDVSANVMLAQTFPMEEFRPRIKQGEDSDAFLRNIRYYTLIRLHETLSGSSYKNLCYSITDELARKVLPEEYTARDD
jgi:hypothetical protein